MRQSRLAASEAMRATDQSPARGLLCGHPGGRGGTHPRRWRCCRGCPERSTRPCPAPRLWTPWRRGRPRRANPNRHRLAWLAPSTASGRGLRWQAAASSAPRRLDWRTLKAYAPSRWVGRLIRPETDCERYAGLHLCWAEVWLRQHLLHDRSAPSLSHSRDRVTATSPVSKQAA